MIFFFFRSYKIWCYKLHFSVDRVSFFFVVSYFEFLFSYVAELLSLVLGAFFRFCIRLTIHHRQHRNYIWNIAHVKQIIYISKGRANLSQFKVRQRRERPWNERGKERANEKKKRNSTNNNERKKYSFNITKLLIFFNVFAWISIFKYLNSFTYT